MFEVTIHVSGKTVEEMIKAVREDKKIGRGTCSIQDEAMTDQELVGAFAEYLVEVHGMKLIKNFVRSEQNANRIYWERSRE